MQYYRCRCGKLESWGSMSPARCIGCANCGTNLAQHPDDHKAPVPHDFSSVQNVQTDEGEKTLTLCRYCHRSRTEIEGP